MFKLVKKIALGAVVAVPLLMAATHDAKADPPLVIRDRDGYWNNYWGWYDRDYRPYYRRHYSYYPGYASPQYGYYGNDFSYSYDPYYPNYGYYNGYRGNAVNIGPLHFSWR